MPVITNPGQTNLTPHLFIPRNGPLLGSHDEMTRDIATNFLAIQNWADMVRAGTGVGLRFATKVVAASDSVDLDPVHYDYLCTGTNDQATINAALTAAGAGGRVLLMEGHYNVNPTVAAISFPFDNQTLEGQGQGTRIRSIAGLSPGPGPSGIRIIECVNHGGVRIANLVVDGNDSYTRNTLIHGIVLQTVVFCWIDKVDVMNVGFNGIIVDTSGTGADTNNVFIRGCALDHCGTLGVSGLVGGILIGLDPGASGNDSRQIVVSDCLFNFCHIGVTVKQCSGVVVANCIARLTNDFGFYLASSSEVIYQDCVAIACTTTGFSLSHIGGSSHAMNDISLINCRSDQNGTHGYEINGVTNCLVQNCVAGNNGHHGFVIEAEDPSNPLANVQLQGCSAHDNSQSAANTYSGYYWADIGQPLSQCFMSNCMSRGTQQQYGCDITVQATSLTCVINDFHASGTTGNFHDAGTGTIKNLDGSANNWNRVT